ncbi:MAG: glycosyltransferase family 2 protein [Solirubrobacterales bacterium]
MKPAEAPSFAVVIPAYEAAATIGAAIDSLGAQTQPPAEIIVCDDGSADDLAGALAPYGDAVTLLRQEHRGVAAARNRLLHAAGAEFVVPLDADDVYAPTRLQRLGELAAARPELDILSTDAVFVSAGRPGGRFGEGTPFAFEDQAEAILERCFVICPAMRRRLQEIGGYDEALRTAEDWDVCIRLILTGSTAGLVDEPLLEYRLGSASLTASRVETLRERAYMLEKAAAMPGLSRSLRQAAEQAAAQQRARALEQAAREALAAEAADARRRLLAVAGSSAVPARARLGALGGAIAPHLLRRLVEATVSGSSGRPSGR